MRSAPAEWRTRRRRLRRERGVALMLVLGALTILTVMLTESQDESSADFASALATRDQLVAEYAAKSGINLSRLLIAAEPTIRTAVSPILGLLFGGTVPQLPVWDHAPRVLGAFNDAEGAEGFASLAGLDVKNGKNLGFDGGGFDIEIIDEDSKIDLNAPARGDSFSKQRLAMQLMGLMAGPQYDPLFSNRDADGQHSDRMAICGAIIDFIDPDQDADQSFCDISSTMQAQQTGAEDGFYQSLPRPYERKNAALDSFEELHRVRGMSEDFWSTFIDPDPDDPMKRVVTVWGTGTVNVNTANPQTLYALVCSNAAVGTPMCQDSNEAAKFLGAFAMVRAFTRGAPLFGSPDLFITSMQGKGLFGPVLAAMGMQPVIFKSNDVLKKQMGTESKVFSIYATGRVKSGSRVTHTKIHAVVDFRAAPAPGVDMRSLQSMAAAQNALMNSTGAGQMATSPTVPGGTTSNPTAADLAIQAVLKPSPAGSIIYFRVD